MMVVLCFVRALDLVDRGFWCRYSRQLKKRKKKRKTHHEMTRAVAQRAAMMNGRMVKILQYRARMATLVRARLPHQIIDMARKYYVPGVNIISKTIDILVSGNDQQQYLPS